MCKCQKQDLNKLCEFNLINVYKLKLPKYKGVSTKPGFMIVYSYEGQC